MESVCITSDEIPKILCTNETNTMGLVDFDVLQLKCTYSIFPGRSVFETRTP